MTTYTVIGNGMWDNLGIQITDLSSSVTFGDINWGRESGKQDLWWKSDVCNCFGHIEFPGEVLKEISKVWDWGMDLEMVTIYLVIKFWGIHGLI